MDLLCRLFQLDRGFFVLLLCVVTSIGLSAQNTNDTVVVDVGASTTAMRYNSLLWKIEGENLKAPSFLYGTMHSRNKAVHQLGDSVLVKLNDCEALSLEIVTEGLNQMDMMKSLIASMMMKDTTLQDLYEDKSDYKK